MLKLSCLWLQKPLCATNCEAHTICTQMQAQRGAEGEGQQWTIT